MERRLLVAAVAVLAFAACGRADELASGVPLPTLESSVARADMQQVLLSSWRFESLAVDGVPFPIDDPLFLDITDHGFRAETTCNQVSGTFGGEIVSSLMLCATDAANAGERHMSQALRSEPVQTDDLLVFDDGSVRLVYETFTDPSPSDLFAVLGDQTVDVDESVLPSEQATGTVPPDFDTLVPLPSPSSEVDLFLAVINTNVCVVWGTDTALDMWCQGPRFAGESTYAVNIPIYGPTLFRIALIPDRFGDGVTSRPDLGTYSNNILVVGDDAPPGNHVITDATGATFVLNISTELTPAAVTSEPNTTAGLSTPDTPESHAEPPAATSSSNAPEISLSDFDRQQIFAVAAASRLAGFVAGDNPNAVRIDVIDTIGRADGTHITRFQEGAQFSEAQRDAIVEALAPRPVAFVSPTVIEDPEYVKYDGVGGNVVLSLAEPVEDNGQFRITTALWCGLLCGQGGAEQIERLEDGTWAITGPVGSQWEA